MCIDINSPDQLIIRHNRLVKQYNGGRYFLYAAINRLEQKYAAITETEMYKHPDFIDIDNYKK